MLEVNARDARNKLCALLDMVEAGEEIVIKRRRKKFARIIAIDSEKSLPSLKDFHACINVKGKPMSQLIADARR